MLAHKGAVALCLHIGQNGDAHASAEPITATYLIRLLAKISRAGVGLHHPQQQHSHALGQTDMCITQHHLQK